MDAVLFSKLNKIQETQKKNIERQGGDYEYLVAMGAPAVAGGGTVATLLSLSGKGFLDVATAYCWYPNSGLAGEIEIILDGRTVVKLGNNLAVGSSSSAKNPVGFCNVECAGKSVSISTPGVSWVIPIRNNANNTMIWEGSNVNPRYHDFENNWITTPAGTGAHIAMTHRPLFFESSLEIKYKNLSTYGTGLQYYVHYLVQYGLIA
jgi:hypothetical protein